MAITALPGIYWPGVTVYAWEPLGPGANMEFRVHMPGNAREGDGAENNLEACRWSSDPVLHQVTCMYMVVHSLGAVPT